MNKKVLSKILLVLSIALLATSIFFAVQLPSRNKAISESIKNERNWQTLYTAASKRTSDPATVEKAIGDYYAVFNDNPYIYAALEYRGTPDYYEVDLYELYKSCVSAQEGTERVKQYFIKDIIETIAFFVPGAVTLVVYLVVFRKTKNTTPVQSEQVVVEKNNQ